LPENYELPLPAVEKFGFGYDPAFFAATGARSGVEWSQPKTVSAREPLVKVSVYPN